MGRRKRTAYTCMDIPCVPSSGLPAAWFPLHHSHSACATSSGKSALIAGQPEPLETLLILGRTMVVITAVAPASPFAETCQAWLGGRVGERAHLVT